MQTTRKLLHAEVSDYFRAKLNNLQLVQKLSKFNMLLFATNKFRIVHYKLIIGIGTFFTNIEHD